MKTIAARAPAKVNLHLEVLFEREDGYHEIETIFQAIDLHDRIEFRLTKGPIHVSCAHPSVPEDRTNLCHRAAKRGSHHTGAERPAHHARASPKAMPDHCIRLGDGVSPPDRRGPVASTLGGPSPPPSIARISPVLVTSRTAEPVGGTHGDQQPRHDLDRPGQRAAILKDQATLQPHFN